jgi:hypothetical protein
VSSTHYIIQRASLVSLSRLNTRVVINQDERRQSGYSFTEKWYERHSSKHKNLDPWGSGVPLMVGFCILA